MQNKMAWKSILKLSKEVYLLHDNRGYLVLYVFPFVTKILYIYGENGLGISDTRISERFMHRACM